MIREKLNTLSEKDLMIGLIKSDKFCRELTPIINIRYLTTDYHKILFSWIKEFYDEFKESPKKDIIKIYRVKAEQITDDVLLDNLLKFIENVCQNYDKQFNEDFVLKESINYLKKQSLTNLNLDLDSYLSTGQIDKAEMRLLSYKSLEKASGKSISMFDKVSVMNAFSDENDVLFKMKGAFGKVIGDIHREDFVAFLACMKRGKTFTLIDVAVEAMKQGLKVLHVSLEMSENQVMKRYWINLTGQSTIDKENIPFSYFEEDGCGKFRVLSKNIHRKKLTLEDVEKKEKVFKRMFRGGEVKIYAVPAYSLSVDGLEQEIIRLTEYEDYEPDVVIVDYADIMRPTEKGEYRNQLDSIWKRLRSIAQDRNIAVITASQSGRNALTKDAEAQDIAEDIRKMAHVTSLVAINQTEFEKQNGVVRFKQLAVREGEQEYRQAVCTQCLSIGRMVTDSKFDDEVFNVVDEQKEKDEKSNKNVDRRTKKS
jgi:KaiC/GvpD/RAD55 family RecA-like ATPase